MRKLIVIVFALLFNSALFNAQNFEPDFQSNDSLDFTNFLSGVKYACLVFDNMDNIEESSLNREISSGIIQYLKKILDLRI